MRVHQHTAEIKDQDISKCFGGNSSKIHLAVNIDRNPLEIIISDGTTHDVKIAPKRINKLDLSETKVVYTNKRYDSKLLRKQISTKNWS